MFSLHYIFDISGDFTFRCIQPQAMPIHSKALIRIFVKNPSSQPRLQLHKVTRHGLRLGDMFSKMGNNNAIMPPPGLEPRTLPNVGINENNGLECLAGK